jgi:hypothetical protein
MTAGSFVTIKYSGFHIAVLMIWVEYKKQINYEVPVIKYSLILDFHFLNITPLHWSVSHAS